MPFMRRRGGGLLGMAARTAVVAGTATAVSHKMQTRYATKEEQAAAEQQATYEQGQQDALAAQQAPPPPAPAPAASGQSVIDQLKELAQLKDQGILTDEEFAQQKAKLLA